MFWLALPARRRATRLASQRAHENDPRGAVDRWENNLKTHAFRALIHNSDGHSRVLHGCLRDIGSGAPSKRSVMIWSAVVEENGPALLAPHSGGQVRQSTSHPVITWRACQLDCRLMLSEDGGWDWRSSWAFA